MSLKLVDLGEQIRLHGMNPKEFSAKSGVALPTIYKLISDWPRHRVKSMANITWVFRSYYVITPTGECGFLPYLPDLLVDEKGETLRYFRDECLGLSLNKAASKLSISLQTYRRCERRNTFGLRKTAVAIAEGLNSYIVAHPNGKVLIYEEPL